MSKVKKYINDVINFWKKTWGSLVAFIILVSIIALFIASFVLDKCITLSVMNEWVSLILGMVATIMSVISLFLSFYNVEQSNEVQTETVKIMTDVKEDMAERINNIERKIDSGFSNSGNSVRNSPKVQFNVREVEEKEEKQNV